MVPADAETIAVSTKDRAAGVTTSLKYSEGLVRATLLSPATRDVSWKLTFPTR